MTTLVPASLGLYGIIGEWKRKMKLLRRKQSRGTLGPWHD